MINVSNKKTLTILREEDGRNIHWLILRYHQSHVNPAESFSINLHMVFLQDEKNILTDIPHF